MLSEPESCKRVDEARRALHGTNHQMPLASKFMRDAKKPRKHLEQWDSSDDTPEGCEWRHPRAEGGCCRLRNMPLTAVWKAAGARQIPPNPITLFYNDWILHFLHRRENSDPEAPEGTEARARAVHPRTIADVIAAFPDNVAQSTMGTPRTASASLRELQLAISRAISFLSRSSTWPTTPTRRCTSERSTQQGRRSSTAPPPQGPV